MARLKLMQRIDTKDIRCESLQIVDHQDPERTLALLSFKRAINNDPTQLADRVGTLQLRDSDGRTVCEIATDVMVGRLVARQLLVVDPQSQARVLVGTEPQPALSLDQADGAVSYQGVIYLNNQPLAMRFGPRQNQPGASPAVPAPQFPTEPPATDQPPVEQTPAQQPPIEQSDAEQPPPDPVGQGESPTDDNSP